MIPPQRRIRARVRELDHRTTSSRSIWSAMALMAGLQLLMARMKSCNNKHDKMRKLKLIRKITHPKRSPAGALQGGVFTKFSKNITILGHIECYTRSSSTKKSRLNLYLHQKLIIIHRYDSTDLADTFLRKSLCCEYVFWLGPQTINVVFFQN